MGLFERFPYTNFHELNADWLLKKMKELDQAMETFKATESLKFADPIIWDITTQYQKSTVVLDPTGNAYLSLQPVPAGVQLNNDEYWLEIFNFTDYTRTANKNLTVHVETNTTRATDDYAVDDWLIWEDVLYKVIATINVDDALVVGTNLVHFTVEDFIKAWITYANGLIQQYKNDIDYSELQYRNQLAQDIANTTATLQAQLNAAISGATVDSEVINARVGWDNTTYATLRDSIIGQISQCIEAGINGANKITGSNYSTKLPDANNLVRKNQAFMLEFGSGATSIPAHLPFNAFPSATPVFLICTDTYQILFDRGLVYTRFYEGAWGNWVKYNYNEYLHCGYNGSNKITSSNYATVLPDLNSKYNTNEVYFLEFGSGATSIPAHLPFNAFPSANPIIVICTDRYQIVFDRGIFYTRYYVGAWANWVKMTGDADNALPTLLSLFSTTISGSNYSTQLPDLDNASPMKVYALNFGAGSTAIPAHMPYPVNETTLAYLMTFTLSGSSYGLQIFIDTNGGIFTRVKAGSWGSWISLLNNNRSFVEVNNGDNLVAALINNEGREIHVQPGTYDIIADYQALYGATYFDNYTGYSDPEGYGAPVRNGTKLIFSPFARVTCNYTGNNAAVAQYFSAFSMGTDGSITGLNLYTRHLRYAIHDDLTTSGIWGCNEYHNCIIDSDTRCIGGGMKNNMRYVLENCIFKSQESYDVSYHNANTEGEQSFKCTECYFEHSIRFGYYGSYSNDTKCFVNNNSLGAAILKNAETPGSTDNITIYEWNNIIRP